MDTLNYRFKIEAFQFRNDHFRDHRHNFFEDFAAFLHKQFVLGADAIRRAATDRLSRTTGVDYDWRSQCVISRTASVLMRSG